MPYIRAHIRFNTTTDAKSFVSQINADGTTDKYIIEDVDGVQRADARSILGVIYALSEYGDNTYLVNMTRNGVFPSFVDAYRA